MAEIQDIDDNIGELEAVEQQQVEVKTVPELPEKYRGKSIEDVVKMHRDAEELIARQGREVGEVRKLADELIKSQLTPKAEVEKPKEIDFFENPQEAIRQQIENNPRVQAAEQYAKQAQAEQSRQRLVQMHPDFQQIVGDTGFKDWVNASKVRAQLFQQADNYDLDAANELISTYKELRTVRQKQVDVAETAARTKTLNAVAVDTGGSGESTQKIYRRADLIRLKMRDPSKYESMNDEILEAYRTGRVK
jgi:hypothetical protein